MICKPLTDILKGRHPEFFWTAVQQAAFDKIRTLLLGGIHLAAPDYEFPFHLATDASEDGKGGVLHQLPDIALEEQHPCSTKTHAPDNMALYNSFLRHGTTHPETAPLLPVP
jgi:hypothetical protein